jgi:hypothetical protein
VTGTYSVTHVRNSEIKQLLTLFFAMLWDIDLIFGMWVYSDKLQIEFTFRSGPMIMARGLWNLAKYLVVTTFFHYAWRYWFLVWECIILSYRSALKFVPVEWFLAKYLVVITFFSLWFEILTWFLVCEFKEAWGYRSQTILCYS